MLSPKSQLQRCVENVRILTTFLTILLDQTGVDPFQVLVRWSLQKGYVHSQFDFIFGMD